MPTSYEFDPCTLDGSDKEDEVTLDNWKPTERKPSLQKSQWRQDQNNGHCNLEPGIDELAKINMYVKKKYADSEIMSVFGINSETLVAIKRGCYSPVDGISLDNQSKIYKEFARIDKKLSTFLDAFKFIADNLFTDKESSKRLALQTILGVNKKKKKEEDEEELD